MNTANDKNSATNERISCAQEPSKRFITFPPPFIRCVLAYRELIIFRKFAIVNIVIAKIIKFVHFLKKAIGDDAFGHGTLCAKRRILGQAEG